MRRKRRSTKVARSRVPRPPLSLVAAAALVGVAWVSCTSADPPQDETRPPHLAFDRELLLEQEAATSANVSIGDLDQDGHLDIVLVKGRHWPLSDILLMGDGAGGFAAPRPLAGGADRSYSGVLVDIDADGDLDIVISNDQPDANVIHLNDGHGEFTAGSSFGRGEWPTRHVNIADVNGDGQPDIVVANRMGDRDGFNYVCLNRGAGRFDSDCMPFSSESSTTITPADFNGDGAIDLAVPHREGGQSRIYLNDGQGAFDEHVDVGAPDAAVREAEAADLNGDGALDLVVIDERSGPAILPARAEGGFDAPRPLGGVDAVPYALELSDLNGDGHMDVIVGYVESRPVAFFNDGAGAFTAVPFGDDRGVAYGFAAGDIDEDGIIDIAVARSDAPNVLYFGRAVPAGR